MYSESGCTCMEVMIIEEINGKYYIFYHRMTHGKKRTVKREQFLD